MREYTCEWIQIGEEGKNLCSCTCLRGRLSSSNKDAPLLRRRLIYIGLDYGNSAGQIINA
eukprot:1140761-Pelagomonas_calceolata.AAC.5